MVENLIRQARRRFLFNEALAETAFAATVFAAGFALVLILGTRFLSVWSLVLFGAAGVGLGVYRVVRKTPDAYTTAVRLDESQGLHDALSTALHYSTKNSDAAYVAAQRAQAEAAAVAVQPEQAVPWVLPRALYALAGLAVLATGLAGLRYRSGSLDLKAPITSLLFEDRSEKQAKKESKNAEKTSQQWMEDAESLLTKLENQNPDQPLPGDPDALQNAMNALQQAGGAADKGATGPGKDGEGKGSIGDDQAQSQGDPMESADKGANGNQPGDTQSESGEAAPQNNAAGKPSSSSKGQSLLSKLKDALSSLMSQGKPDQTSEEQKGDSNSKDASKNALNSDQTSPSNGTDKNAQSASTESGDSTSGQKSEGSQNKLNSKDSSNETGDPGSGIGSQDGSKAIKAAAQLKAMGKISEIIGKRSVDVSGETSVEVQSGNQGLRTAYSKTKAAHHETDGDVTRDEIPVSEQAYIQQYYAEVRKATAPPKAAAKGTAKAQPAAQ